MGLRIWETDPEAAPKKRTKLADVVGRFRSGYQAGNRPVALSEWRVTTGDPELASELQELLGGPDPEEWETKSEDNLQVFTTTSKLHIVIDSPKALRQRMVLWGRAGAIRVCDGVEQSGEGAEGKACECPKGLQDRKDAAKKGSGCQPEITLYFHLVDLPDAGRFRFTSGSWQLVRDLGDVEDALNAAGGPVFATLELEVVEWTKDGQKRSFTKPNINIGKALTADECETFGVSAPDSEQ
jgi:hypothetical protein